MGKLKYNYCFSPSYTWILLLRELVGEGMAGTPHG